MSVPVWKRKLSSAEYVYQVYQLNIRLGEILINKPQKYKANYADNIIQTSLSALKHVQIADSIYMSKYTKMNDYNIRRENLLLAKGEIQHIATACYIFLEIVRKHDYASEGVVRMVERYAKLYDQEMEIGGKCEDCHNLMDDSYLIHPDRDYVCYCLEEIKKVTEKLGIKLNERKTVIHNMKSDDFVFLKKRIHITDNGKIVMRLTRENIRQERKRTLLLREEYDAGRMPIESIKQSYQAWRGYAKKYDSYHTVGEMDKYFYEVMKGVL